MISRDSSWRVETHLDCHDESRLMMSRDSWGVETHEESRLMTSRDSWRVETHNELRLSWWVETPAKTCLRPRLASCQDLPPAKIGMSLDSSWKSRLIMSLWVSTCHDDTLEPSWVLTNWVGESQTRVQALLDSLWVSTHYESRLIMTRVKLSWSESICRPDYPALLLAPITLTVPLLVAMC